MRYVGVNLELEDYLAASSSAGDDEERVAAVERLVAEHDRITWAHALAGLASTLMQPDLYTQLREHYRSFLGGLGRGILGRFDAAMADDTRSFLGRHVLLKAAKEILGRPEPTAPLGKLPPYMAVVMLAHALAGADSARPSNPAAPMLSGFPEDLALSLVRNQVFHVVGDIYAVLDRQLRLWHDYGPRTKDTLGGREPADLFRAATGAEVADFLALGFALYAHFMGWKSGAPVRLNDDFNSDMPVAIREAFLSHVAAGLGDLSTACAAASASEWDFLGLQARPVLRVNGGLLVLDGPFLAERFTSGLYWIVHDYLKTAEGEPAREAWTWAWGQMIEEMAEDDLRPHAPRLIDGSATFYDEADVARAYPGRKTSDCVIDFGPAVAIFEVVSARLVNATRIGGDRRAFEADMDKIVLKKVRQLDATAQCLLDDPEALFGKGVVARPIQAVVVAGEEFPTSPVVTRYVEAYCQTAGLLRDSRARPLAIIDLGDLEQLEGLAQGGHSILEILAAWKRSDLAEFSLRNYLLERYPWRPDLYRPQRMRPRVDATFKDLATRLAIRAQPITS